jgi:hypothetical protein
MAERPKDFPALPKFTADKTYEVKLWKAVEIGGRNVSPSAKRVTIKGDIAEDIIDAIYTAQEVKD